MIQRFYEVHKIICPLKVPTGANASANVLIIYTERITPPALSSLKVKSKLLTTSNTTVYGGTVDMKEEDSLQGNMYVRNGDLLVSDSAIEVWAVLLMLSVDQFSLVVVVVTMCSDVLVTSICTVVALLRRSDSDSAN